MRRQQVALVAEVKAVLDSWVQFEQQEKENEQAQLVKTIDNVLKSVSDEKFQKDVLACGGERVRAASCGETWEGDPIGGGTAWCAMVEGERCMRRVCEGGKGDAGQ